LTIEEAHFFKFQVHEHSKNVERCCILLYTKTLYFMQTLVTAGIQ